MNKIKNAAMAILANPVTSNLKFIYVMFKKKDVREISIDLDAREKERFRVMKMLDFVTCASDENVRGLP
jgi:Cdc6-like AAA superfamily ATPase